MKPLARLIGADTLVPCVDGRSRRYVNLDYAASTPVMAAVWEAVAAYVPWYSSVHRGSGLKSQLSTAAFEDARRTVAEFVGAEHAIAVCHGCFCAHPLMTRLLGVPDDELARLARELRAGRRPALPGAVRASLGLGTTRDDIDRLTGALHEIATTGPSSRYRHSPRLDEYQPEPRATRTPAPDRAHPPSSVHPATDPDRCQAGAPDRRRRTPRRVHSPTGRSTR
jgi:Aminotransferase class-V